MVTDKAIPAPTQRPTEHEGTFTRLLNRMAGIKHIEEYRDPCIEPADGEEIIIRPGTTYKGL